MRSKIEAASLNWEVDSAGTGGWHVGEAPDPRSQEIARQYGLDISAQRARKFNGYDLEKFDRIYAMDPSNLSDIIYQAKSESEIKKVKLIMNELEPNSNIAVPDPYYGEHGFEKVYQMLDKACAAIINNHR